MVGRGRSEASQEMKVCDIQKKDGVVYVDDVAVPTTEDAYKCFRTLYNTALGTANYLKFGHVGVRTSLITKTGIVFEHSYLNRLCSKYANVPRVRCYLMGIVDTSYCRIVGCYDFYDRYFTSDECEVDSYLDWVFSKDSGVLRQYDRRNHLGRTNTKKKIQWKKQNKKRLNSSPLSRLSHLQKKS